MRVWSFLAAPGCCSCPQPRALPVTSIGLPMDSRGCPTLCPLPACTLPAHTLLMVSGGAVGQAAPPTSQLSWEACVRPTAPQEVSPRSPGPPPCPPPGVLLRAAASAVTWLCTPLSSSLGGVCPAPQLGQPALSCGHCSPHTLHLTPLPSHKHRPPPSLGRRVVPQTPHHGSFPA